MPIIIQVVAVAVVLILPMSTVGQGSSPGSAQHAKRLRPIPNGKTVVVKGNIGGESHDSYVLDLAEGEEIVVGIASRGNRASFVVSSEDFGEPVEFGTESEDGRRWVGRVPRTGSYYVAVVAHPQARYSLTVAVRR
jgi:hypothetical protein